MTRTQQVLAGVAALFFIGFYLFGYRPAATKQQALAADLAQKQLALAEEQQRAADLPAVQREVDRLQAELSRFDERVPQTRDFAPFMTQVTQLSQQLSLKRLTVLQGDAAQRATFTQQSIDLTFTGDFSSVATFIQRIEAMPRLSRVRALSLKSEDDLAGTVDVKLAMELYFNQS